MRGLIQFSAWWLAALGVALLGRLLVVCFEGSIQAHSPGCTFRWLTGLYCAGCGGTRAMFAFMHGELAASWSFNPVFLLLLATLLLAALRWTLLRSFPGRFVAMRSWRFPLWLGWALLAALLLFGVLRNLPWWPFTLLTPT